MGANTAGASARGLTATGGKVVANTNTTGPTTAANPGPPSSVTSKDQSVDANRHAGPKGINPKMLTVGEALKVRGQRQESGVKKGYHISKSGLVVQNQGRQGKTTPGTSTPSGRRSSGSGAQSTTARSAGTKDRTRAGLAGRPR